MKKITPFLWFDDKAEEAMNYYISIFKNTKILGVTRYGEEGPGPKGTVMTAAFELNGQEIYRTEWRLAKRPIWAVMAGHSHCFSGVVARQRS